MNHDAEPDSISALTSQANQGKDTRFRYGCLAVYSILTTLAVPIAFLLGHTVCALSFYKSRAEYQEIRIEHYLKENPQAYGQLEVVHASNGWAYPQGSVNSQADHDRLSKELLWMFGDELSEKMMDNVEVNLK
ncbi:hypothetical protein [Rubinisphaera sp.]|uniref:hypothetical protein n=1 Tax=Rubinisphaera sp. TaxID=2024857 RepID=UPI0025F27CDD|nr:hypothetical protein [Rubinisphaera sp.]|tara:strand:+ start:25398 stop:25796 length:399 start_codon:yes stop_codon:yes gene_type:complete